MNKNPLYLFCVALILGGLIAGCASGIAPAVSTSTPSVTETLTPSPTPANTDTPVSSPTERPTPAPGNEFDVTIGEFVFKLEVPSCNLLSLGFGGKSILPLNGDAFLCLMSGDLLSGIPEQSDLDAWVNSGEVYLIDLEGRKGNLVYASVNTEKKSLLLIFSVPENFSLSQMQFLDMLIDLP